MYNVNHWIQDVSTIHTVCKFNRTLLSIPNTTSVNKTNNQDLYIVITPPIIIDVEASGFGINSYPIEIGYASQQSETWCSLIKPEQDWQHWDVSAERTHGITREKLFELGKPACDVAQDLNDRLQGCTVYTDGWGHDYIWLSLLFETANASPHFKIEDLRLVLTPRQADTWEVTKALVQQELSAKRHRASIDARVIQLTWLRTLNS